ncbi:OapA family protein [Kalamiella sp. sgz302252]|uniref:OapA family protein n=1 Tax=Pantoea sp. sgz302252 TaxID=3341827 RepID=UPI0036D36FB8
MPATKASSASRWFNRIWHLTDSARWMDPLPPFHRRGIVLASALVLLAFLWPSPRQPEQPSRPVNIERTTTDVPLQAELSDPADTQPKGDAQGEWTNYQIASGQTLAQLFRDHNLPVNDVFAMARVEGSGKPLSNLQAGQAVRIRQNSHGVVTGLAVTTDQGEILFTRQPDGAFLQVHQATKTKTPAQGRRF